MHGSVSKGMVGVRQSRWWKRRLRGVWGQLWDMRRCGRLAEGWCPARPECCRPPVHPATVSPLSLSSSPLFVAHYHVRPLPLLLSIPPSPFSLSWPTPPPPASPHLVLVEHDEHALECAHRRLPHDAVGAVVQRLQRVQHRLERVVEHVCAAGGAGSGGGVCGLQDVLKSTRKTLRDYRMCVCVLW